MSEQISSDLPVTPVGDWSGARPLRQTPLMACPIALPPSIYRPPPVPPVALNRLQCNFSSASDARCAGDDNSPKCRVGKRGTITVLLEKEVMVEITDDRNVRLLKLGSFALTSCSGARRAAVHHPQAQIYQDEWGCVFIRTAADHCVRLSPDGLMTLWSAQDPTASWNLTPQQLEMRQATMPQICPEDVSLRELYSHTARPTEAQMADICHTQVEAARHFRCGQTGSLFVFIHGFTIHQNVEGHVEVLDPRRKLTLNPTTGAAQLLYAPVGEISLGPQGYLEAKFGAKRLHLSPSGLVLSNGYKTAAFDESLRLISHT